MDPLKSSGLFLENLYRPIYELNQSYGWGFCAIASVTWVAPQLANFKSAPLPLAIAAIAAGMGIARFKEALPLLRRQFKLQYNYWFTRDPAEYREWSENNATMASLGRGFEWTVQQANRAYQIVGMTDEAKKMHLPWWLRGFSRKYARDTVALEGVPWLQGVGDEKELIVSHEIFWSHSLYTGLPGTGKTVMLSANSVGSLHRGCSVIVIDPKNDPNWKRLLRAECEAKGLPFHFFSPVKASESVRLDPMRNFVVTTELASRMASVLGGGGDAEAFRSYAWDCFYLVAEALRYIGRQPRIKTIADFMLNRKNELARLVLGKLFEKEYGSEWAVQFAGSSKGKDKSPAEMLFDMIAHYQTVLVPSDKGEDAVSSYLGYVTHDAAHSSKMLASTKPVLQQLTAAPLDELLSPDPDAEDERPIIDIKKFVDTGGVLYIATDSMGNGSIAAVISKLIMEDACAAAAARYNHEDGEGRRVAIYVDEAHAAISDGLINMLAQARGAKYELHVSTQSYPDLAEKAGPEVADRIVGLTANWFCMRVLDKQTTEMFINQLPEVPIRTKQWQLNTGTDSDSHLGMYSGTVGERMMEQDKVSIPKACLSMLPKMQYFARLADGRFVKGRTPILTAARSRKNKGGKAGRVGQ